jgi:hypothetical protein
MVDVTKTEADDANTVESEVTVSDDDRDVDIQTGGLAVDVDRPAPEDEPEGGT